MTKINSKQSIARRLSAYSAVAAGTVAAAGNANAAEVVWDIPDLTTDIANGNGIGKIVKFDMEAGTATYDNTAVSEEGEFAFFLREIRGLANAGIYAQDVTITTFSSGSVYDKRMGVPLGSGASISDGLLFDAFALPTRGIYLGYDSGDGVPVGQTAFLGLKFELNGELHYGWAEITRPDNNRITLHSFGYNDTPDAPSVVPGGAEVEITTLNVSDGTATITFKGKPNTIYTCKSSTTLIGFSTTIPTSGSTTTDENGDATFQVAAAGAKSFYLIAE